MQITQFKVKRQTSWLAYNGLRLAAAAGYEVDVIGFAVMKDKTVSEKRQAGCEHNRCSAQSILS